MMLADPIGFDTVNDDDPNVKDRREFSDMYYRDALDIESQEFSSQIKSIPVEVIKESYKELRRHGVPKDLTETLLKTIDGLRVGDIDQVYAINLITPISGSPESAKELLNIAHAFKSE